MEVTVNIEEGESLTLGIRTSCLKPDGTQATSSEATGWFKVDHFRIERVEEEDATVLNDTKGLKDTKDLKASCYDLCGRQMINDKWVDSKLQKGIYVQNGKKILKF